MPRPKRLPIAEFVSQERVPIEIVHRQAAGFVETPPTLPLLDSLLNYVFVLNQQGQIVFSSPNVTDLVGDKTRDQILGSRLGEALGCSNAAQSPDGCGTSPSCGDCGALQSILHSLTGRQDLRDYHLTSFIDGREKAVHFLVLAAPLVHGHEVYSVLALAHGADAKARQALKRFLSSR